MKKIVNTVLAFLAFSSLCLVVSSCGKGAGGGGDGVLSISGAKYKVTSRPEENAPEITQVIEFKKDNTYVVTAGEKNAELKEMMKGTYQVNGNKINVTPTWVFQDDPNDPLVGKTGEIEILEGGKKIKFGELTLDRV